MKTFDSLITLSIVTFIINQQYVVATKTPSVEVDGNTTTRLRRKRKQKRKLEYSKPVKATRTGRIIGGDFVSIGTYPWFTMLLKSNGGSYIKQGCGGMLVSPEFVLTAAHCINHSLFMSGAAVKIGALESILDDKSDNGGQYYEIRTVQSVYSHPEYDDDTFDNDFALLHLSESSTITPVSMDFAGLSQTYPSKGKG
jgi:secreted trypsin-like serine protease